MSTYRKLTNFFKQISVFDEILSILEWDTATVMPHNSRHSRINQIKVITNKKKEIYYLIKKLEIFKKVDVLKLKKNEVRNLSLMKRKYDFFCNIPSQLIIKNQKLAYECEGKWREAKKKNNYNIVKKEFIKLYKSVREKSKILSDLWNLTEYDAQLSLYDQSFNSMEITKFADDIELFVTDKYEKFLSCQKKKNILKFDSFLNENEQFQLSKYVMNKFGFNFKKGRVDTSLHPFCGGYSDDVRITTKFNKQNFFSSFDALMHETGHALYEFGLPKIHRHQLIGKSGGMSLHESQSLFIEMQIVKTQEFNNFLEELLRNKFNKTSLPWKTENLFSKRNEIKKGFIRIESDEIHYPLHIIHRFNLEKKLFNDENLINYLPDLWNSEFKRIFNLEVNSDNDGCLQDIHWYSGDFGYFPTYLIGAIIAAQLKKTIEDDIPNISSSIESGNFKIITKWLNKNIHSFGNSITVNDLLLKISGQKLKSKFYKNHLKNRYLN